VHTSPSGIRDNHRRGSAADFLRAKIADGAELSVVTAYFTIYAYARLRGDLNRIGKMRLLFGEPRFVGRHDPDRDESKAFVVSPDGLTLGNRLQLKRQARECADWIREKVEIRTVRQTGFLHGKLYHIARGEAADALLGSSNFTVPGLGLADARNNIELNLEVNDTRDRRDLLAWFDELWNDEELVADVKDEVLSYLAKQYEDQAPEFVYFKTLFHLFEQFLRELDEGGLLDEKIRLTESEVWKKLFDFQRDGVRAAINKLLRHGGCILADSVGLGKTWEALAVVKYFELRNERVLVLCPKKLRGNWDIYPAHAANPLNPFPGDRYGFTVLSHTDLSRQQGQVGSIDLSSFHWENFDLVVIDESHNFRNDTKGKPDKDGNVRKSRYEKLIEDVISQGVKTKVLLLSATPVNNDLSDLRNQLRLVAAGNDAAFAETLSIPNLANTLKGAQGEFTKWAKQPPQQRDSRELLACLDSAFFKLLDELTIARSRDHIRSFYQKEMARLGGFPERAKPDSRYVEHIDLEREFPNYEALYDRISKFRLAVYNPSRFVKKEHAALYENRIGNFTQAGRETFLLGMMRVGFLKRLESSVHSFAATLDRTTRKITGLEARIAEHQKLAAGKSDVELTQLLVSAAEDDEELRDALEIGGKVQFQLAHLRLDDWLAELAADKKTLAALHAKAKLVAEDASRDGKLADLKGVITAKVRKPTPMKDGTANRKVVVFTAFADTARYLYDQLAPWAEKELGIHTGLVTGGDDRRTTFGTADFDAILSNFAPRAKERHKKPTLPQTGEIDLLIATDCISEGQNLQDCDTVINYDIHWNPVRLIQRFGRVDRIGSRAERVHLVNYWPVKELDRYVKLKDRVETRMALVDLTATGDDNLLDEKRLKAAGIEDAKEAAQLAFDFRDEQLKRLQSEVLDLEEMNDSIALTDFTLDAFRAELAAYVKANEQALRAAPFGLYACVPGATEKSADIAPGVIFCLREKDHSPDLTVATRDRLNPLRPYWLAYVHATGDVRYTYAHPKRTLEIFRELCAGKTTAHADLCTLFDQQTQQGEDMSAYSTMLDKAVASFSRTFQKQAAALLQTGRDFIIPKVEEQPSDKTDFELVSWLVLLTP
jgi:hypothetical protein